MIVRLGWTLLHFLWQGTAIAVVHAALRRFLARRLSAEGRYALACLALAAMAAAPLLTFLLLTNGTADPAAQAAPWALSISGWQQLLDSVVALWLTGVSIFSLRLIGAWRITVRLRSASIPAPIEWQQTVEEIAAQIPGAKRAIRLLVSPQVDVPTVFGWLRPVILVPLDFLTGVPVEHITALLTHEIAHIGRHDYLASVLQSVVEAALFYHPAVWWISGQIRSERELCCDDLAIAAGTDVLTYARALAELESRQPASLIPALSARGGSLVNRIRRLLDPAHASPNTFPGSASAWAMVLLWLAGIGTAAVHGAQTTLPASPTVNRSPVLALAEPGPAPALRSPFVDLASHARHGLLYDPLLSAQLAQPRNSRAVVQDDAVSTLPSPWREWLEEDVTGIVTPEERAAFEALNTDGERASFVEQFWLRRDPTPGTIENEFKEEHYRRIAWANEHFASRLPGRKTDRGRTWIHYGPPDEIDSHPSTSLSSRPFEDWHYYSIEGRGNDVKFEFVDTSLNGEYHLTSDPLEKDALPPSGNRFAKLQVPPESRFKDLEAAIGVRITEHLLPMLVRVDYVRVTASSVIANITIQCENGNSPLQPAGDVETPRINILGRISTMTGKPVAAFEKPLADNRPLAVFQQSVPLPPGRYRLNIVAQDTDANMNVYEVALNVPPAEANKLASSSLIIADAIERLPARSLADASFVIGDSRVSPRLGKAFTGDEKMGIYLQLYNFTPDEKTQKPSGSIHYEIDKTGSNERVMDFSEDAGTIPNASPDQVTIKKLLPLSRFEPGVYILKVTATDAGTNQIVQQQQDFTISPR